MPNVLCTVSGHYVKISTPVARKLYNNGESIFVKGASEHFSCVSEWFAHDGFEFDNRVNEWLYYNKHYYGNIQFYRLATDAEFKACRMY